MAILRGRMSCLTALASSITNIFSFIKASAAGKAIGILIGIFYLPRELGLLDYTKEKGLIQ
jgi:hypothetical protein